MKITNNFTNEQKEAIETIKTRMGSNCYIDKVKEYFITVVSYDETAEYETKIYADGEVFTCYRGSEKNCIWSDYEKGILPI